VVATFIPEYGRDGYAGALAPLALQGPTTRVEIGLVRRPDDPPSSSVDALADWLRRVTTP
jgi:DNA-binding transcriptional LysR family regulator